MIIAIDGPAASGKGTIARRIADVYGLHHLDTGLIYRAVAKAVLDAGHSPDNVEEATAAAVAWLMAVPGGFEHDGPGPKSLSRSLRRSLSRARFSRGPIFAIL